ncbi:MAG: glutathione synthase [Deltaproteobacteria bacterium]|nr:glutathione synthase [Deltaproteobacteria bacterium]
MALRIAVVADPVARFLPDKDTTFVLMLEAQRRGHAVFAIEHRELFARGQEVRAVARRVELRRPSKPGESHFTFHESTVAPLASFDAVLMRSDPPVDDDYLYATHLLSLVEAQGVFVLNRPAALRDANEKLYALNFPDVIPRTLVARDLTLLKEFLAELGGEMIVKPPHGWGGLGIFHVHAQDRNLNAILEMMTDNGHKLVMAQEYVKAVRDTGDERVILVNGEPMGAVARIPREDEHRSNLHVGGTARKVTLGARERRICDRVASRLRADGLWLVGLDIIGDFLTEVNVTSPTGIQEIDRLDGITIEARVIDLVERKVAELKR